MSSLVVARIYRGLGMRSARTPSSIELASSEFVYVASGIPNIQPRFAVRATDDLGGWPRTAARASAKDAGHWDPTHRSTVCNMRACAAIQTRGSKLSRALTQGRRRHVRIAMQKQNAGASTHVPSS
jgi:hypothetical protein